MDAVGTCFDPLQVDQRRHSGHAVAVQLQRDIADHLLDCWHERANAVDCQKSPGILEPDSIDFPPFDEVLGRSEIQLVGVHRRQAVGKRAECFDAETVRYIQRSQHVVDVVEPVEGADFAKAVGNQPLNPKLDDVIGKNVEADQIF